MDCEGKMKNQQPWSARTENKIEENPKKKKDNECVS
jgi:hypothetical protein